MKDVHMDVSYISMQSFKKIHNKLLSLKHYIKS